MPTSITFEVGWSGDASADTPDLLQVTLDKPQYRAGESMKVQIASRFAGKATVAIVGDKVNEVRTLDVKIGDNLLTLPVTADWGTGAYAVAIAHRPLDQAAKRMPGRALGLAWFGVDQDQRRLDVSLDLPPKMEPRRSLAIPVRIGGLVAGEDAYVTLAAVDIGILNLTNYEAPNPTTYFFGQRLLGTDVRDLSGYLIDGMQGSRGAIRTGGDAGKPLGGAKPTQEPLSRYSGVVKVGPDGVAQITFEVPAFNGSMRVMAVAWSKSRVGQASGDVIVRDPVVVQATLPRFLALYPDVAVDLAMNDGFADMVEEGIDLAIRVGELTDDGLIARRIGTTRRVVVATPEYLARKGEPRTPADLAGHDCIVYSRLATGATWPFVTGNAPISVPVSGRVRVNNTEGLRAAVLNGIGIGMVPIWHFVDREIETGAVKVLLAGYEPKPHPINAVYPSRRHLAPKVRAMIDFLAAAFERDPQLSGSGAEPGQ